MRGLTYAGEYLVGILTFLVMVPFLLAGLVVSLFELPRYLRMKSK